MKNLSRGDSCALNPALEHCGVSLTLSHTWERELYGAPVRVMIRLKGDCTKDDARVNWQEFGFNISSPVGRGLR